MGLYIQNQPGFTKEQWLDHNALQRSAVPPPFPKPEEERIIVCLIDNGPFKAAGVAYSKFEYDLFQSGGVADGDVDDRGKVWYVVPRAAVLAVCPQLAEWEEQDRRIRGA